MLFQQNRLNSKNLNLQTYSYDTKLQKSMTERLQDNFSTIINTWHKFVIYVVSQLSRL